MLVTPMQVDMEKLPIQSVYQPLLGCGIALTYRLPADLQAFLFVSNGFTLQWDGVVQRQSIRVGSMCLNGVKSIQRIDMDHW